MFWSKNQELLEENRKLSQQVIELQQAKIDSLVGTTPLGVDAEEDPIATTEMNSDPSAIEDDSMSVDNTGSAMESEMSVDTPSAMEGETPLDTGSEYMDDVPGAPEKLEEEGEKEQRQMGGTKRRKNKQRKTKRKRKGSKK